jgi:aconitate hydratase 2/2-methylisocitrate dehydratase
MKNMIADGYADKRSLERRIKAVEAWLAKPELLEADKDAEYAHVIEIDLADLKEPVLCCPNDPDDAKLLSDVAGTKIDEVFIGSCMTNIGHFRAASKLLEGKRDIPGQAVGGSTRPRWTPRADQGRPLRRVWRCRCSHRNARLQPVHG